MLWSRRATVLAETGISTCLSSSAIFWGVLRVHFKPVIGSPAVSCSNRISMASTISAFFFRPADALHPFCVHQRRLRPGLRAAVVRERQYAYPGSETRPVDDPRHVPVSEILVRRRADAAVRRADCRTGGWRLSAPREKSPVGTHPPRWGPSGHYDVPGVVGGR